MTSTNCLQVRNRRNLVRIGSRSSELRLVMVNSFDNWIRVSYRTPCPICGREDNCLVSRDGVMTWCGRISDGSLRENKGGQFLHRLQDDSNQPRSFPVYQAPAQSQPPRTDLPTLAEFWFRQADEHRPRLAKKLGIHWEGLKKIGVGWNSQDRFWSFPEKDASGNIIGISRRFEDGTKKRLKGGKAGLTYPEFWNTGTGPVFLVEGGSDTAALIGVGLSAVGRPSNLGGVALLEELLTSIPRDQDIIVLGERDEKPNGRWPGKEGAVKTAIRLADALDRTILWSLPPDDAKDARDWIQQKSALAPESAAVFFCSGLATHAIQPPPTVVIPQPDAPVVSLTEWRQAMYAARLESLQRPGYYLDTSMTGTGKSSVDVQIIIQSMGGFSP